MNGETLAALLSLGVGSAAVGIRLIWELHQETNGDGKIEAARKCFMQAKHEAGQFRAELSKLDPGADGRRP